MCATPYVPVHVPSLNTLYVPSPLLSLHPPPSSSVFPVPCSPSAGLLAAGVPEDIANNALRVSIGRSTTKQEVARFVQDLKQAVKELEEGGTGTE